MTGKYAYFASSVVTVAGLVLFSLADGLGLGWILWFELVSGLARLCGLGAASWGWGWGLRGFASCELRGSETFGPNLGAILRLRRWSGLLQKIGDGFFGLG